MRMTSRITWIVAGALLVMAPGCEKQSVEQGGRADQSVNWKMASSFPASLPLLGTGGPYYTERIKTISRGRINITFFDPGKLVPALEVFDAVSNGAVDAGWAAPGYWFGKIPAATLFGSFPFGPELPEFVAWMFEGGGLEIYKDLYARHNLWVMPCQATPAEASGWFRQEITSIDQFKGMKIRFYGLGGQVMQKLGASVQLLATGDLYPALERGVLDATEFGMPIYDVQLGLHKIAKHYYFPGWHQPSSFAEFFVNMDRWKSLDAADQALLESVCKETVLRGIGLGESLNFDPLDEIKKSGVQIHVWPDEMLAKFRATWEEVVEENRAKDPDFKRAWDSFNAFHQKYREWDRLSKIPKKFQ